MNKTTALVVGGVGVTLLAGATVAGFVLPQLTSSPPASLTETTVSAQQLGATCSAAKIPVADSGAEKYYDLGTIAPVPEGSWQSRETVQGLWFSDSRAQTLGDTPRFVFSEMTDAGGVTIKKVAVTTETGAHYERLIQEYALVARSDAIGGQALQITYPDTHSYLVYRQSAAGQAPDGRLVEQFDTVTAAGSPTSLYHYGGVTTPTSFSGYYRQTPTTESIASSGPSNPTGWMQFGDGSFDSARPSEYQHRFGRLTMFDASQQTYVELAGAPATDANGTQVWAHALGFGSTASWQAAVRGQSSQPTSWPAFWPALASNNQWVIEAVDYADPSSRVVTRLQLRSLLASDSGGVRYQQRLQITMDSTGSVDVDYLPSAVTLDTSTVDAQNRLVVTGTLSNFRDGYRLFASTTPMAGGESYQFDLTPFVRRGDRLAIDIPFSIPYLALPSGEYDITFQVIDRDGRLNEPGKPVSLATTVSTTFEQSVPASSAALLAEYEAEYGRLVTGVRAAAEPLLSMSPGMSLAEIIGTYGWPQFDSETVGLPRLAELHEMIRYQAAVVTASLADPSQSPLPLGVSDSLHQRYSTSVINPNNGSPGLQSYLRAAAQQDPGSLRLDADYQARLQVDAFLREQMRAADIVPSSQNSPSDVTAEHYDQYGQYWFTHVVGSLDMNPTGGIFSGGMYVFTVPDRYGLPRGSEGVGEAELQQRRAAVEGLFGGRDVKLGTTIELVCQANHAESVANGLGEMKTRYLSSRLRERCHDTACFRIGSSGAGAVQVNAQDLIDFDIERIRDQSESYERDSSEVSIGIFQETTHGRQQIAYLDMTKLLDRTKTLQPVRVSPGPSGSGVIDVIITYADGTQVRSQHPYSVTGSASAETTAAARGGFLFSFPDPIPTDGNFWWKLIDRYTPSESNVLNPTITDLTTGGAVALTDVPVRDHQYTIVWPSGNTTYVVGGHVDISQPLPPVETGGGLILPAPRPGGGGGGWQIGGAWVNGADLAANLGVPALGNTDPCAPGAELPELLDDHTESRRELPCPITHSPNPNAVQCPNGIIDAGEECDPAAPFDACINSGLVCSTTCLCIPIT